MLRRGLSARHMHAYMMTYLIIFFSLAYLVEMGIWKPRLFNLIHVPHSQNSRVWEEGNTSITHKPRVQHRPLRLCNVARDSISMHSACCNISTQPPLYRFILPSVILSQSWLGILLLCNRQHAEYTCLLRTLPVLLIPASPRLIIPSAVKKKYSWTNGVSRHSRHVDGQTYT